MELDTKETDVVRVKRRRYDAAFKREVVDQTFAPGVSVARVAREHGINANQVFKWRRQQLLDEQRIEGAVTDTSVSLVPVNVISEKESEPSITSDGVIEITLGGARVWVRGTVDSATLDCVLSSLRR